MIHTSLSPNTEKDDVFLAFQTLIQPWTWGNWGATMEVEGKLREMLGVPHVVTVDSGRTALYTILKAAGICDGDEVIVQAYTCVAVPDPVLWVGARPVFVDCKNDLTIDTADLAQKITPYTKAIVVQHTFGATADIDAVIEIAREKNILIIEDCAHALMGKTADGRMLGSVGDVSFFSFGRDKSISSVFGGAIATKNGELFAKISKQVAAYPAPDGMWVAQQLMHPLVLAKAKILYNVFKLGKVTLEIAKRLRIISKAVQPLELSGGRPAFTLHKFSPALAGLALHQLEKLPRFAEHRHECAKFYAGELYGSTHAQAPRYLSNHAYLRYAVFVDDRKAVMQKARERGIYLGDWYTTPIAPNGVVYEKIGYVPGSCPNAERLAAQSVNLPTHIGITRDMMEKVVNVCN